MFNFFSHLEIVSRKLDYGTMTCNVIVNNGVPDIKTLNIVLAKRKRFPPNTKNDKVDKKGESV